jgi:hypothetical protein
VYCCFLFVLAGGGERTPEDTLAKSCWLLVDKNDKNHQPVRARRPPHHCTDRRGDDERHQTPPAQNKLAQRCGQQLSGWGRRKASICAMYCLMSGNTWSPFTYWGLIVGW